MISYGTRRRLNATLALGLILVIWAALSILEVVLFDTPFLSGWLLLATLVLLTCFNARKKLPFLPLGSAATWLQFHIYIGFLSAALFCLHIDWRVPNGALETALALIFVVVALSGMLGLLLSRTFPSRLTTRGETVLFERIPVHIAGLRDEARALALQSVEETNTTTVADFYGDRLAGFFQGPKNVLRHLLQSDRPRRLLIDEVRALERYATPREVEFLELLADRVRRKNDLDYQYAMQAVLKAWLFVHVPLTYSLLLLVVIHTVLVHAFDGGI